MLVEEITEDKFKTSVSQGLVMIDFWAPWCAPCRMIAPILEELQEEMGDKAKIVKLNVDENPAVATEYGVTSIPTLLIFKAGRNGRKERWGRHQRALQVTDQ